MDSTCSPHLPFIRPALIALLKPNIAFSVPVNQRASCFALTHKKYVSAQVWGALCSGCLSASVFRINLPVIHPFEIIITVADGSLCAENCHLIDQPMSDREAEPSGRALLH